MRDAPAGLVVDLGNTRLKVARVDRLGLSGPSRAVPIVDEDAWGLAFGEFDPSGGAPRLAISSVNPPVAARLERWIGLRYPGADLRASWFRSAADVPVRHALTVPATTGADRALAVYAAGSMLAGGGWVVSCGTAITVERIDDEGIWRGGAIAAGLGLLSRTLDEGTAQLPLVEAVDDLPTAIGTETRPAIEAGVFWGAVGAIRELLMRQGATPEDARSIVWTGGDAGRLAPHVVGHGARVVPDLVLRGLASAAFGEAGRVDGD